MLIAAQRPPGPGLFIFVTVVSVLIVGFFVFRRERRARRDNDAASRRAAETPGKVHFQFRLYSGFLVSLRQETIDVILPIDQAEEALRAAVRQNLTRGIFSLGGLLVPFFTYFDWRAQRRRIERATKDLLNRS